LDSAVIVISGSAQGQSKQLDPKFNFISRNCLVLFTHCINFRARFRPAATFKNWPLNYNTDIRTLKQ